MAGRKEGGERERPRRRGGNVKTRGNWNRDGESGGEMRKKMEREKRKEENRNK